MFCFISSRTVLAEVIKPGANIEKVAEMLKEHGYGVTELEMLHRSQLGLIMGEPKTRQDDVQLLKFWRIAEGTLIVSYKKFDGTVTGLDYYLVGEGNKSSRKDFSLPVSSFDPGNGEMVVKFEKPSAEK
jgi:hypothetical protein